MGRGHDLQPLLEVEPGQGELDVSVPVAANRSEGDELDVVEKRKAAEQTAQVVPDPRAWM
jgi:hypothetical protein